MSAETWKPVVGWEGLYEVSDIGRVRSYCRGGCRPIAPSAWSTGHLRVSLGPKRARVTRPVHQLVLEAFVGPRPTPKHVTRHLNGDPADNRPANLTWGTQTENMYDAVRHGTHYEAGRTHCPRGHEYNAANTLMNDGSRTCRVCARERMAKIRSGEVVSLAPIRVWARENGYEVSDTGPIRKDVRDAYAARTKTRQLRAA